MVLDVACGPALLVHSAFEWAFVALFSHQLGDWDWLSAQAGFRV